MRTWLRRIRGAVGIGLTWAIGWGLAVVLMGMTTILLPGTGLEVIFEAADDELLPMMVVPAFVTGLVFSTVLGIVGRRRRFDELSLPQFAAWGAIGGLLLSLIPAGVVAWGEGSLPEAAAIVGPVTLLSSVSATVSLALARGAGDRDSLQAGTELAGARLTNE